MHSSLFTLVLLTPAIFAQSAVPVPKSSGAVPVTPASVMFGPESKNVEPVDLAKHGYVEEEFFLTGTANVYDWNADGSISVKTPNAPYTDRVHVRRPTSPSKFSGTVIVEIANTARRFDWAMMWGFSRDYIMEHGDAWVAIGMPASAPSMKTFNPARYGSLAMANPTPGAACPGAGKNGPSDIEDGLRWDIFSQVAAALKSNAPGQPLAGFKVDRIFMTTQTGDIVTYINAIHEHATLANGKPAYDGYVVRNPSAPARINQCAPNIAQGDSRRVIKNINVPVVSVTSQGEAADGLWSRKPDSDDPTGRYRLYEIAGAAHIDHWAYAGFPSWDEQKAATGQAQGTPEWPFNAKCEPEIPLSTQPLLRYAFDGAFNNIDTWVKKGTAPPKASRLEVKDGALVLDDSGNAKGGVRNPWVEVPTFMNYTTSPGPGTCRELGHFVPFDAARLSSLYTSQRDYLNKVNQSVDRSVKAGFFTDADGKRMKADLAKSAPALNPAKQ